jgi:hypothetical protein
MSTHWTDGWCAAHGRDPLSPGGVGVYRTNAHPYHPVSCRHLAHCPKEDPYKEGSAYMLALTKGAAKGGLDKLGHT